MYSTWFTIAEIWIAVFAIVLIVSFTKMYEALSDENQTLRKKLQNEELYSENLKNYILTNMQPETVIDGNAKEL